MLKDWQLRVEVSYLLKHSTDLLTRCCRCGKIALNCSLLVRRWGELVTDKLIAQLGVPTQGDLEHERGHTCRGLVRPRLLV